MNRIKTLPRPEDIGNDVAVVDGIVNVLLAHRKVLLGDSSGSASPQSWASIESVIRPNVERGESIEMTMPSFPFSMPNQLKKFGLPYPDMSEELSLIHLDRFCREIGKVYRPGARLTIVADGHVLQPVWNRWFRVSDDDVRLYISELRDLASRHGLSNIRIWDLEDAYPGKDVDSRRKQLLADYPVRLSETSARIHQLGSLTNLAYAGQKRYFLNDGLDSVSTVGQSNSRIRERAGEMALEATHLADAWAHRFHREFPGAVRLSCHAYPAHMTEKIGIYLTPMNEETKTPWHTVALHRSDTNKWEFVWRFEARARNASLIRKNGRPSHFVI